jgi:hypothetical protein
MLLRRVIVGRGPVWFRPWPSELQMLIDALHVSGHKDVRNVKAYCVQDFLDAEYVWRIDISADAYDSLKQSFDVEILPIPDPSDGFWRKPPRWWNPDPRGNAEYLVWNPFTWDVVTLFDKKNEILYGWSLIDF